MKKTDREKFREKVKIDKTTGCWLWTGAKDHRRYGRFYISKKQQTVPAHLYLFEIVNGKIPKDCETHHRCQIKNCVNPNHIKIITHKKHMQIHSKTGIWRGEKNGRAKRTNIEVLTIKTLNQYFMLPGSVISEKMRIPQRSVYSIISGEGWNHIKVPSINLGEVS